MCLIVQPSGPRTLRKQRSGLRQRALRDQERGRAAPALGDAGNGKGRGGVDEVGWGASLVAGADGWLALSPASDLQASLPQP